MDKKLIVIIGPTAAKKSQLAHLIARHFHGAVINGDAFQIYKEINVGVNKPSQEEILDVPYYLIDEISWRDSWSIAHFQKRFDEAYNDIINHHQMPILCGGSHLYTDCIIHGYDLSIDTSQYENEIQNWTNQELLDYINQYDPISANKIGLNNLKRLQRCVVLLKANNNQPKSETDILSNRPQYDCLVIMVTKDRQLLYDKINQRFDQMFSDDKWTKEVQDLINQDPNIIYSQAFKAIGYCEIANALLNNTIVDTDKLKQKTRQLAKRQLTWCNNKFPNKIVFDFDKDDLNEIFKKIEEFYYD